MRSPRFADSPHQQPDRLRQVQQILLLLPRHKRTMAYQQPNLQVRLLSLTCNPCPSYSLIFDLDRTTPGGRYLSGSRHEVKSSPLGPITLPNPARNLLLQIGETENTNRP